jgi:hypothetical protein
MGCGRVLCSDNTKEIKRPSLELLYQQINTPATNFSGSKVVVMEDEESVGNCEDNEAEKNEGNGKARETGKAG